MATLDEYTNEELLSYARTVRNECDQTPVGVLSLLVELTRRLGDLDERLGKHVSKGYHRDRVYG